MNTPKPFDESRQSQDEYCSGCVHADSCNVMLKDGEECGDRLIAADLPPEVAEASIEREEETDDPRRTGIYIPPVGGQPGRTIYGDWDK